jgi:hypothetical protein
MSTPLRHIRRLIAGFLAGISCVGTVLVVIFLLLLSNGIFAALLTITTGAEKDLSIRQALSRLVSLCFQTFPRYVWDTRWIMLAVGLLGLVLAGVDLVMPHVRLRGRAYLGLSITLGSLIGVVVGTLLTVGQQTLIVYGFVLAIISSFLIWTAWLTWFYVWIVWLRAGQPRIYGSRSAPPVARAFLEAQARIGWLKRPTPSDEPHPYIQPYAPSPRTSIRLVLGGWAVSTMLLVLVIWLSQVGVIGEKFGASLGLTLGLWLTMGTTVLVEGFVVANWLDDNQDARV